ncbi:MAG: glycosyltransferase, partial [Polyangiaceae bacterium]|nr:glycosyltransferase [Polyangiaceae bacterium]
MVRMPTTRPNHAGGRGRATLRHLSVLRQASLVALPSYREGLPLALAEAAACGRAVVTTDVPGCREVVRHGETGWLGPPRASGPLARAIWRRRSRTRPRDRRGAASGARGAR